MVIHVSAVDLRKDLARWLREVEVSNRKVLIKRHDKEVAVLVSMEDFNRVWQAEDEELYGPVNPETGRRRSGLIRAGDLVSRVLGR